MKVAYDVGVPIEKPTGVGRYIAELGHALVELGVELYPYRVSFRGRSVDGVAHWRIPAKAAHLSWRKSNRPAISHLVGETALVHGTNFVLPALGESKGVLTIHDLSFDPQSGFGGNRRLSTIVPWSIEHASAVVVPSAAVAAEVTARYGYPNDRIFVTPEGVNLSFFEAEPLSDVELGALGISRPFVIAVGTLQPRKNLFRLLDAWKRVASQLTGWTLALVGQQGEGPKIPDSSGVVTTGWVDDRLLHGLLARAEFFCYPSLYEGFGLPPLEAMAAGTPALVGNYPAASEVVGDLALIVDRMNPDDIAEKILQLAHDDRLRRRLAVAGRTHAARFTWTRTARATMDAYEAALGGGER
jgi:glycosyltransferase involved in cell wall biosynthesis